MEKKKLNWFSMKAVAFHFDGNLKKNLTFSWKILMEKKKLSWCSMKAVAFH